MVEKKYQICHLINQYTKANNKYVKNNNKNKKSSYLKFLDVNNVSEVTFRGFFNGFKTHLNLVKIL